MEKNKIRKFINDNNLSFEEGSRNTTVVCTIGYAQHLGLTEKELQEELKDESGKDSFIYEEIARLFDYCKIRNYKKYWTTKEAKEKYKF